MNGFRSISEMRKKQLAMIANLYPMLSDECLNQAPRPSGKKFKYKSNELLDLSGGQKTILLSMSAAGDALLTVFGLGDEEIAHFPLLPNAAGWEQAAKISAALNEWINLTKKQPCKIEP